MLNFNGNPFKDLAYKWAAVFVLYTKPKPVPRHIKITKYAWVVTVYPVGS